jgi:DNA primase
MSFKNTDFKGAKSYLKDWRGLSSFSSISADLPLTAPNDGGKPPESPNVLIQSDEERIKDLNTVKDYYHKKLFDHSEALEYLQKRGLKTPQIYERFQIGFAGGSLLSIIGETQKQALTEAGILNDKGFEHFKNCLIFPIFDDANQTIGFYGRDIDDNSSFKHRYLKGPHSGVFNRKASKVYDEIILAESIIDALSLIETGLENAQAIYGTNGFTDEHIEILKADRVKTVVLALDNDEAGEKAAETLKERLINEGFKVKILSPYGGKDWNEALVNGELKKDDLQELINQLAIFEAEKKPEESQPFTVKDDGQVTVFQFRDIAMLYRVAGVKDTGAINMRVNIRAELQGEKYFDNLDLYSARSRFSYAQNLSKAFGLELKRIEKDLVLIVDYFDEARLREKEKKAHESQTVELSEADRRVGLEFLKAPDLFNQIVKDMEILGYVGEDLNKQLLYLCASSRILDDPISILILSESASGKSMLVETIRKLMPPEDVIAVTSLSDQALNYIKDLLHKFLILGEAVHSDVIEHQIREMLSGKELSRLVTVKDEKTGKMESKIVKTPVIAASVMSSTAAGVNPENASRCFIINADESREQTRRIHEAQRQKYSLSRYFEKEKVIPEIIKKHLAAQRLLRNILIVNPFGEYMNFPDQLMRTRRDNDRFLDLIACVCFLRQYQKPVKLEGLKEFIECELKDYSIAYEIMVNGVLSSSLLEIPKGAAILYEEIRRMARDMAERNGIKPEEVSFIQRDIREYSKFNNDSIKKYLKNLVDLEYIQIVSGKSRGTRLSYRLRKDEELEKIDLTIIPTPENMSKRLKDASQSGENVENDGKAL